MRLQALLALLTMFALAFAGCAGDTGEPEAHDDHEDDDVQPSATQTTTQAATSTTAASSTTTSAQPPANQPPTGSISATVNGTNASFSLAGSDPDGETVVWDLDFGDGETTSGTELPATVEHTFLVGNYTVRFTITDGKDPVVYSVPVAITAGVDAAPIQVASGEWQVGAPGCLAQFDAFPAPLLEASGTFFLAFEIDPLTIGQPYTMTMTWDATPAALGGDISFFAGEDSVPPFALIEGNLILGTSPLAFEGTVPAGASHAVVSVCDAPGAAILYAAG